MHEGLFLLCICCLRGAMQSKPTSRLESLHRVLARLCSAGLLVGATHGACADALFQPPKDAGLAAMLASLKIEGELELRSGFGVRVFSSGEPGECDPGNEAKTCPKSRLYIVTSLNLEGPEQARVWISKPLIGWRLEHDPVEVTEGDQSDRERFFGVIELDLSACRAPAAVESGRVDPRRGGWWKPVRYRARLSMQGLEIQEVPADDLSQACKVY